MTGHGGKRTGAGRKTDAERKVAENSKFDLRATDALPQLFDTLMALAIGVKVGVYRKPRGVKSEEYADADGQPLFVYSTEPDKAVLMYLTDRAAGKSAIKQAVETDTNIQIVCSIPRPEVQDAELDV